MVVIAASLLTKTGKILLSRQFVPTTKMYIEGLLASFPKLLGTDSQHTFIETENVRFVYQSMEQIYLVMITNKQSNIMEDLETLRIFAKLIPEFCTPINEENIRKNLFNLIYAFDEVVTIGYRENINVQQIKTNLLMDSHEEKLQKIIMESKMNEARDEARRKAEQIDKRKQEERNKVTFEANKVVGSSSTGFGSANMSPTGASASTNEGSPSKPAAEPPVPERKSGNRGMQLGKGKKTDELVNAIKREEEKKGGLALLKSSAGLSHSQSNPKPSEQVQITIEEKLVLQLDKEAGIKKLEIKGEMKVVINDPDQARIIIQTNGLKNSSFKSRLHPKMNQELWNKSQHLGLKESNKPFPVGSENAPVIVKWRLTSEEERDIPINLNFWPSNEDGRTVVSVEYSLQKRGMVLHDVRIAIPCKVNEPPQIAHADGTYNFDNKQKIMVWFVEEISDSKNSGSMEFSVNEVDGDTFYPINISFTSPQTYSEIQVTNVVDSEHGKAIEYHCDTTLSTEKFTIEAE